MTLLFFASACASAIPTPTKPPPPPVDGQAICYETRKARADVARDVAVTTDDKLAVSAGTLVLLVDAGCAQ
jgi:hypothetical protein